jgi:hypothetical protein
MNTKVQCDCHVGREQEPELHSLLCRWRLRAEQDLELLEDETWDEMKATTAARWALRESTRVGNGEKHEH